MEYTDESRPSMRFWTVTPSDDIETPRAIIQAVDAQVRQDYDLLGFWFRWCILHGLSPLESMWTTSGHPSHLRCVDANGTVVRVKIDKWVGRSLST